METLYLIVSIAGQRVALPADDVESVVEIDMVTPVPLAARHVAGLAALRSRVITVIDTLAALDMGVTAPDGPREVVTLMCDGHLYGLLVDTVEDVIAVDAPIHPVRTPLAKGWRRVVRGMIEIEGAQMLLLDASALVADPTAAAA